MTMKTLTFYEPISGVSFQARPSWLMPSLRELGSSRHLSASALACLFLCIIGSSLAGAAWPTYRHDARRSGVVSQTVELPMTQAWMHGPTHPPSPAWPELPAKKDVYRRVPVLGPTTSFDEAFHVAVADGTVCFGSSSDDTVYCLDAADGKQRWSFVTDGPVRLAPVMAGGQVYVGSDDGCVYCLRVEDGRLVWKHRGGPEDRRLPGNGRMISLWPVRCGIVVDNGTVYFCAGLFPQQGSYLCAVRADDGKEVWKQEIQVPAQGYLSASASFLFVPTGRSAPQVFERKTGKPVSMLPGGGPDSKAGGCYTVLDENSVAYSAGETSGILFSAPESKEKILFADGQRVVTDGAVSYILTRDRLCALDRAHWLEVSRLQVKSKKTPAELERFIALGSGRKNYLKWEIPIVEPCELILAGTTQLRSPDCSPHPNPLPSQARGEENRSPSPGAPNGLPPLPAKNLSLSPRQWGEGRGEGPRQLHRSGLASQTLLVGELDRVSAYDADGKMVWRGTVRGRACGIAVSDGRLYVSTDQGFLHCFQPGTPPPPKPHRFDFVEATAKPSPYPADAQSQLYAQAAESAIRRAGVTKGYCLVLGARTGRLAYEIASGSQFQVVGVEPDAQRVAEARKRLAEAGLYGTRVTIHQGDPAKLPFQRHWANLIVSEETLLTGKPPASSAEVHRVLRPCGGTVALLTQERAAGKRLADWGRQVMAGWKVEDSGGVTMASASRGPLPGAGEWSHFYGDA
ncbi:MAG: methyltransferase domain-containing protein, partial [Verrucomicrobia bacterium]|nr:methyltransferase domain-containing protein [Verrucomicrobiota bacterium]